LSGRTAVVTGASGGIGRSITLALADAGAHVFAVARSADRLEALVRPGAGAITPVAIDATSGAAVAELATRVADAGPLTALVNSAGVFGPLKPITQTDPDSWLRTIAVNLGTCVVTARHLVPLMVATGRGVVLNASSAASLDPPGTLNSAYAVSKVAVNRFTRHLAVELAGTGVVADVFHPGDVRTAMFEDIRHQVASDGHDDASGYGDWVAMLESTGGDPPERAAELVLRIATDDTPPTGRFLWIEHGIREPIASWT
jgi:NAD(P)-dependent dehydrogenase (short-subunit alcohol dehydrogenase family)